MQNQSNRPTGINFIRRSNFRVMTAMVLGFLSAILFSFSAHAGSIDFDNPDRMLDLLIDMDARDISNLQKDLRDVRIEIVEAIDEIEAVKVEEFDEPGMRTIARVAVKSASAAVSNGTRDVLRQAYGTLDQTTRLLDERRSDIDEAEFNETSGALSMIRGELGQIEVALSDLVAAINSL